MARSARWAWIAAAAALWAAGPAVADEAAAIEADELLAEMGAEYFARYCASCHGMAGNGRGPAASALAIRPADLTRIAARRGGDFPEGEIARKIDGRFAVEAHGTREMPVWGERFAADVPDSQVAESIIRGKLVMLVEYLKSIQVESGD